LAQDTCFDQAIQSLVAQQQIEEAESLMGATVHWLRHTGISEDVKTRPREHVRDDAGHSSSAITDKYIDIELKERHKSAKKKRIRCLNLNRTKLYSKLPGISAERFSTCPVSAFPSNTTGVTTEERRDRALATAY
jgi:hypothetical protein